VTSTARRTVCRGETAMDRASSTSLPTPRGRSIQASNLRASGSLRADSGSLLTFRGYPITN
jgi:hypothetical protein